jgi:hypothetical protein
MATFAIPSFAGASPPYGVKKLQSAYEFGQTPTKPPKISQCGVHIPKPLPFYTTRLLLGKLRDIVPNKITLPIKLATWRKCRPWPIVLRQKNQCIL